MSSSPDGTLARNIPETVARLKKLGTVLSKRAAADMEWLLFERVLTQQGNEAMHVTVESLKAELATERATHNNMSAALREATAVSSIDTLPPSADAIALAVAAESKRCAALALGPYGDGWMTDRTYEDMDKPQYGEAVRTETARRILAPVAAA